MNSASRPLERTLNACGIRSTANPGSSEPIKCTIVRPCPYSHLCAWIACTKTENEKKKVAIEVEKRQESVASFLFHFFF